jgi:hypothetical protein
VIAKPNNPKKEVLRSRRLQDSANEYGNPGRVLMAAINLNEVEAKLEASCVPGGDSSRDARNPVGVAEHRSHVSQGSRVRQPWAVRCNPFGIVNGSIMARRHDGRS